jgi:hypothetical protein
MKFDLSLVNKAFQKSFAPTKNVVTLVHLVLIVVGAWLLSWIGGQLAMAVRSAIVMYVFMGIAVLYAVIIFSSMAYFLYYYGLAAIRSDKKAGFGEALSSLQSQPVAALGFVVFIIAILLVQALVLWLLSLIPEVGLILIVLLVLPLFVLDFFLWTFMLLGGILCYPTMIDQKKGIFGVIKNVAVIIKQKLAKLLLFHVLQTIILVILFLLLLLIFSLAMQVPGMFLPKGGSAMSMDFSDSPLAFLGSGIFQVMTLGQVFLASPYVIHVILGIIMIIYSVVIFGMLLSWLLNFSCGLVAGFYLHVKDEVDFKDDLGLKKLNIDVK